MHVSSARQPHSAAWSHFAFGLGKSKRCLAGVLEDGAKPAATGTKPRAPPGGVPPTKDVTPRKVPDAAGSTSGAGGKPLKKQNSSADGINSIR